MATDANEKVSQTRVAGKLTAAVGVAGTTMPTEDDFDTPLDEIDGFSTVGFTSQDGATFTYTKTVEGRYAHQRLLPIRYVTTKVEAILALVMQQFNAATMPLGFAGGTVTETDVDGIFLFEPAEPEDIDEFALILEIDDGTIRDRYYVPRAINNAAVTVSFKPADLSTIPAQLAVLENTGTKPWWYHSNDPEFDQIAS